MDIKNANNQRKQMSDCIKGNGYDIAQTAHWLECFYIENRKNN